MEHKRRALAVILATLLMTLGVHGAAQATLIPTLGSVNPSGGNTFVWSYDIGLAFDQNANGGGAQSVNPVPPSASVGDFLTIYDFRGFVSGSCFVPGGWACQTQAIGFTPNTQTPADSNLTNLTFTRTGSTLTGPVTDLGTSAPRAPSASWTPVCSPLGAPGTRVPRSVPRSTASAT